MLLSQTAGAMTIDKASLESTGYTPSATDSHERILMALLDYARTAIADLFVAQITGAGQIAIDLLMPLDLLVEDPPPTPSYYVPGSGGGRSPWDYLSSSNGATWIELWGRFQLLNGDQYPALFDPLGIATPVYFAAIDLDAFGLNTWYTPAYFGAIDLALIGG